MAILEIRKYPDPVLRRKAKPVTEITPEIQKLIDDMIETMYAAPGVGLAAPQVGISLRLTVIDVSTRDDPHPLLVLINPAVISREGELNEEEGCLSVTDFQSNVTRYAKVRIRATDRDGKTYEAEGRRTSGQSIPARTGPPRRDTLHRPDKPAEARPLQTQD